ncbi:glypican-5a isoform X1 [Danio aesculapii]|uniref:glypican-5a isoform X1 n=1 Tax=Danio aesculapii TaxID=1142201 RepID=UPI0024C0657E|nr:glypican-5a isoform X1 [Danio aesculapii]
MGMRGVLFYTFLAVFTDLCRGTLMDCEEVRKVFQLKQIGPAKSIPDTPRTGSDLQVCSSKNLTCCTKKMEERYQVAARRDIQNLLQISSSSLKFLFSRNVAAFQETVESLVRQAENHTLSILHQSYRDLSGPAASAPVGEFFTEVALFILGSELGLEESSQRFFNALFPLIYERLIDSRLSPPYAECLRSSALDLAPFGAAPIRLASRIAHASLPARVFLQALHLGIEIINTTDHIQLSRECRRGLLRMSYCPHCQALTSSKPCMGYCLNVVRGCLANLAEVDTHWREFVRSLETLAGRMHGELDLEQVLLGAHELVRDAVAHAQRSTARIHAQVQRVCGQSSRWTEPVNSVQHSTGRGSSDSIPLRGANRNTEDSLRSRRTEFLHSLRLYRTYYGALADQLCISELASADGRACWNGDDVARSYTLRVVGNGIKAQAENPEVKVKEADPVINQVIDKLKHINQLLQGRSIPKLGSLDQIETGSGDGNSGDCDDEDGCWGSGNGAVQRRGTVTKLTPENTNNHRYHHPQTKAFDGMDSGAREARSIPLFLVWMCVFVLLSG